MPNQTDERAQQRKLAVEKLELDILLRENELKQQVSSSRREWTKIIGIGIAIAGILISWQQVYRNNQRLLLENERRERQLEREGLLRQDDRLLNISTLLASDSPRQRLVGAQALLNFSQHAEEEYRTQAAFLAATLLETIEDPRVADALGRVIAPVGEVGADPIGKAILFWSEQYDSLSIHQRPRQLEQLLTVLSRNLAAALHNSKDCELTLRGAVLRDTVFKDMRCKVFDLTETRLDNVRFENVALPASQFQGTHMTNVSFSNADLRMTRFDGSSLCDVDFVVCNTDGIDFISVRSFARRAQLIEDRSFANLKAIGVIREPWSSRRQ